MDGKCSAVLNRFSVLYTNSRISGLTQHCCAIKIPSPEILETRTKRRHDSGNNKNTEYLLYGSLALEDEIIKDVVQNFWTSHTDFLYDGVHKSQNFWNLRKIALR
jgi:hypothetical protein